MLFWLIFKILKREYRRKEKRRWRKEKEEKKQEKGKKGDEKIILKEEGHRTGWPGLYTEL